MPYERLRIAYMSKLDFSIVRTVHGHTQSLTLLLYVRYKYSTFSLTHVTIMYRYDDSRFKDILQLQLVLPVNDSMKW